MMVLPSVCPSIQDWNRVRQHEQPAAEASVSCRQVMILVLIQTCVTNRQIWHCMYFLLFSELIVTVSIVSFVIHRPRCLGCSNTQSSCWFRVDRVDKWTPWANIGCLCQICLPRLRSIRRMVLCTCSNCSSYLILPKFYFAGTSNCYSYGIKSNSICVKSNYMCSQVTFAPFHWYRLLLLHQKGCS